jgi:hypothetical protein
VVYQGDAVTGLPGSGEIVARSASIPL